MRIATLISHRGTQARVAGALAEQGIEVESYATDDALIAAQATQAFAAILVEDAVPRVAERLAHLRARVAQHTALIVVGEGGAASMSRALLHGADDYAISCELACEHLVQRAIARGSVKLRASRKSTMQVGPYTLDLTDGVLHSQGFQVRLTSRELTLARVLFEQCNQVVATAALCQTLGERVDAGAQRAVKQHMYELRKKLRRVVPKGGDAPRIETVYGRGYRLAW
jgi:DNA-binding response OmpR family regulator